MTQYFLNMPYGDIGFQQMGRIGMAEHMRVDMFFKLQAFQGRSQNALNPTVTHMIFDILGIFSAIAAQGREYPLWIAMGFIIVTQRHRVILGKGTVLSREPLPP